MIKGLLNNKITLEIDILCFEKKRGIFMYTLYGDGIHDDTLALQELIDNGGCEVVVPAPKKHYVISKTLILRSDFRLVFPRFAEIRLAAGSDCAMLQNLTQYSPKSGVSKEYKDKPCNNIEVVGGIWDCNNLEQSSNPLQNGGWKDDYTSFHGSGMVFCNVTNLRLSSFTVKNPSNFAVTLDEVSYFTVDNITFNDYTWNPIQGNMDGIHLNGNCHFGCIRNLKGACFDDLVALNAYEGSRGPISDIEIDGIFAEGCHSAVRLLSVTQDVERISISNVFGTYYIYCIGITEHYSLPDADGIFDGIYINNIFASKASLPETYRTWDTMPKFSLFWFDYGTKTRNIFITNVHRTEYEVPYDTILVETGAVIDKMTLRDINIDNRTDTPITVLNNNGSIKKLVAQNISNPNAPVFSGNGVINEIN